jgi:hypothetical protein
VRQERLLLRVQGPVQPPLAPVLVPVLVKEPVQARVPQVLARRRALLLCQSKQPSGPAGPSWRRAKFL